MIDQISGIIADWGVLAVSIVGVILLLLGLRVLFKMWPVISRTVEIGDALLKLPESAEQIEKIASTQEAMKKDLLAVKHEVQNNDGSSLKDSVDKLQRKLDEHVVTEQATLRKVSRTLGQHTTRLQQNTATLNDVRSSVGSITSKLATK